MSIYWLETWLSEASFLSLSFKYALSSWVAFEFQATLTDPVPAGTNLPTITFSFNPFNLSVFPLIAASVKFGFNLNVGCPNNYNPPKFVMDWVKKNKRKINIFNDPKKAAKNADVVFSDKVVSLNDKVNKNKKIKDFKNYRITPSLMKVTRPQSIFLHCLPRGNEVSEDVFLGKQSRVWQQALNRVHVQKSILLYCFNKLR